MPTNVSPLLIARRPYKTETHYGFIMQKPVQVALTNSVDDLRNRVAPMTNTAVNVKLAEVDTTFGRILNANNIYQHQGDAATTVCLHGKRVNTVESRVV